MNLNHLKRNSSPVVALEFEVLVIYILAEPHASSL